MRKFSICDFLASGFYSGYSPFASGTAGSFMAALLYLAFIPFVSQLSFFIITLLLIIISIPISTKAEKIYNEKDSGIIVIDEFAGMFVTLLFIDINKIAGSLYSARGIGIVFAAFMLFRVFDVIKPYPVRKFEKLNAGSGVVLDDVAAGIYANIALRLIGTVFPLPTFFVLFSA